MDLTLLNKLKMPDTVNLILRSRKGDILEYYVIVQMVSYCAICSGQCPGFLNREMVSFNIRMSSLVPLIEKGYKLFIRYQDDQLSFVTEDERVEITPLYVESRDPNTADLIEQYLNFSAALKRSSEREEQLQSCEHELANLQARYKELSIMQLSGGPPSNPFGESTGTKTIDEHYKPQIDKLKERVKSLQSEQIGLTELNLNTFSSIANVASRMHEVVDLCGDYALLSFSGSYMLQKGQCPVLSINGQLFNTLIRDAAGKGFYMYNRGLVYLHQGRDQTVVFVSKYLPNTEVDQSIITRGVVEEKYVISLKGVLELTSLVKSKFPTVQLDMGNGSFLLTNVSGECIRMKFDVEDVKTLMLKKAMRGEVTSSDIKMAILDIPKAVQSTLPLFRNGLTIYVKHNKVIFQNETLYLVFGR